MYLLSTLPFRSFDDFNITIGYINVGWMEIIISSKGEKYDYCAGHLCDPLDDLLDATVLLLTKEPFINNYYENFRSEPVKKVEERLNEIVYHDLEGNEIVWLLNYIDNVLSVIIWKNIDTEMLDKLCYYNFDGDQYESNEFEDLPDLTENLLFAFNGAPLDFALKLEALLISLESLPNDIENQLDFKKDWGFKYSNENFKKLQDWIIINTT